MDSVGCIKKDSGFGCNNSKTSSDNVMSSRSIWWLSNDSMLVGWSFSNKSSNKSINSWEFEDKSSFWVEFLGLVFVNFFRSCLEFKKKGIEFYYETAKLEAEMKKKITIDKKFRVTRVTKVNSN